MITGIGYFIVISVLCLLEENENKLLQKVLVGAQVIKLRRGIQKWGQILQMEYDIFL